MDPLTFKPKDFVHLHLHSDFSLLQSTIKLKPLAKRLEELEMKACAITDYGNMYGAVSFYNAMKDAGVRPVIGCDAYIASGSRFDRDLSVKPGEKPFYNLVLLATGLEGYRNLIDLASRAFTEGFHYKPRLDLELLAAKSRGLIALSAGPTGAVGHFLRNDDKEKALEYAGRLRDIFGAENFYLEIQDHGTDVDRQLVAATVQLAKQSGIPLVATNDAHYLDEEDARAHEVLLCIGEGRTLTESSRYTYPSSKYFVRSAVEMWAIFGELPDSLTNTLAIAERCDTSISDGSSKYHLPVFPIPDDAGADAADEHFRKVVRNGFEARKGAVLQPMLDVGVLKYDYADYDARLEREIDIIRSMGFSDYFLIVWDFIKYAKDKGIPVGPGRGSAAGSLVAYCLGITDIDPLQYDLLFERFLNPERISMPDIDIDFCIRGRGDVIEHVTQLYGRESVCQIITFGTMASKAAIKDVGRALNMPYGEVEKIAKMIPPPERGRNVSITDAVKRVSELKASYDGDAKVKDLVDLALRVEGCSRHTSVHAAGVVISPKPLHELVPVAMSSKNELTSQYPMGDLEKVGMLKMDFLGLTTLTIIQDCLDSLREKAGVEIDWSTIPLNDEKTMKLFGEGRTDAVFQFESGGMQEICRQMKPKELEDLSALNALYRPGPLDGGMIPDFIARYRGEKKVKHIVPEMEDILGNTYGVLVYQEQIMQIAQKLAGYSLGEADMMRRAMGKKKREEMDLHREKFIAGSVANGISDAKAAEIFELMKQFADYGFNRSHSMAYAYVAFQTAYLKAHYPAYFYAAVLSHESDDSAKVYKYSSELRSLGLKLLPPDVNVSDEGFTPSDDAVRFGLSAIKGIGQSTISSIVEARKNSRFTSLYGFTTSLDQGAINRRGLESLIACGAFDSIKPDETSVGQWRANLCAAVDKAISAGQRSWEDRNRGQSGLFGTVSNESVSDVRLPAAEPWSPSELAAREKEAIGFYLSVHPLGDYADVLDTLHIRNIADHENLQSGDRLTLAGIVSGLQVRLTKKGARYGMFRLEDRSAGFKAVAWPEAFQRISSLLKDDARLIVEGRIESAEGGEFSFIVNDARPIADAISRDARAVNVTLPFGDLDDDYLHDILSVLNSSGGKCDVFIRLPLDGAEVKLDLPAIRVQGSGKIETDLRARGCDVNWVL